MLTIKKLFLCVNASMHFKFRDQIEMFGNTSVKPQQTLSSKLNLNGIFLGHLHVSLYVHFLDSCHFLNNVCLFFNEVSSCQDI